MKASKIRDRVDYLINEYGDREIVISGVFQGGIHKYFTVDPGEYYFEGDNSLCDIISSVDVQGMFVIDEVD